MRRKRRRGRPLTKFVGGVAAPAYRGKCCLFVSCVVCMFVVLTRVRMFVLMYVLRVHGTNMI